MNGKRKGNFIEFSHKIKIVEFAYPSIDYRVYCELSTIESYPECAVARSMMESGNQVTSSLHTWYRQGTTGSNCNSSKSMPRIMRSEFSKRMLVVNFSICTSIKKRPNTPHASAHFLRISPKAGGCTATKTSNRFLSLLPQPPSSS